MCLAAVAFDAHPNYLAVVLANRDEFHARPAAPLALWHDRPNILAGRDLQAGGTWMGLEQRSRFGLVTNFRESLKMPQAPTRGDLVPDFLTSSNSAESHLGTLAHQANRYAGFNLLLHDGDALWYASNRDTQFARRLPAGVHALSNHLLDTPWPKLLRLRSALSDWSSHGTANTAPLWHALADRERAPLDRLPDTGIGAEWESILSSPFVLTEGYGTRCSTLLLLDRYGNWSLEERRYDWSGKPDGQTRWQGTRTKWPPVAATL